MVSRQAITKWESDKGMPDIENLKRLSKLLGISLDYLLCSEECLDLSVTREEINLDNYTYKRKAGGKRWVKKAGKKDMIVTQKYKDCDIHYLMATQILTKKERFADNLFGWVLGLPFGLPDFINSVKNTDKEFYLVNQADKQFLVVVTDEFIESRQLAERVTGKKFAVGDFSFIDCGKIF